MENKKRKNIDIQDLYELIIDLRKKIEKHRELFTKNEASVRYALINPLLEALGWDLADPDDVIPEYSTEAGRPDYVLKKNGKEVAFLGAKALYKKEDLMQYITYCVSKGVSYFITTDGSTWEIYDTYKKADLENKKLISWDIEKEPVEEVIRKSLSLAKPIIYSPNQEPEIKEVPKSLFSSVKEGETEIKPTPVEKTKDFNQGKIKITIDNESPIYVDKHNEILYHTVEWLIKKGYITEKDLPIKVGERGKRYLINTDKKHQDGREFI
ncbi:MAG: hypothetical protein ACPLVI_02730, partial [Thermoplasmata archaeon]